MIQRIIALLKKEFIFIWNNKQSRIMIIVPPLIQLVMFGYAVTMEVRNIELGVWDKCNTVESRELIANFQHSRWYSKLLYYDKAAPLKTDMDNAVIDCAIIINQDFAQKLKTGQGTSVYMLLDGRQINSSAIINGYAKEIVNTYVQQVTGSSLPIELAVRHWFNANLNYTWTILAAVFTMLSTLSCLLLTSMSIAREKELGTFEQLIVSPLTAVEILIGKTIPPFAIGLVMSVILIGLMSLIFAMPFRGSLLLMLLVVAVALLAVSGVGLFISSLCRTQQQALLGVFAYQMPAILMSGFISPVEDMPQWLQTINCLNLMRPYVVLCKGLFFKDMSAGAVLTNLVPMLLIAGCTLTIATLSFKRKLE